MFTKNKYITLLLIILSCSFYACTIKIYDLQPVTSTPIGSQAGTPDGTQANQGLSPLFANTADPLAPQMTNTPPLALAPTAITIPSSVDILKLRMIDGASGWAVGRMTGAGDKIILRTQDGGSTWKNITPMHAVSNNLGRSMDVSVNFADANTAWVLYWETNKWSPARGVDLWITTDGGTNWQSAKIPITGYTIQYFQDVQIGKGEDGLGWIFARLGKSDEREYIGLFITTDGGTTWQVQVSSDSGNLPSMGGKNGALFRNPNEGWINGSNTRDEPSALLWRTLDGGLSWQKQPLPSPASDGVSPDFLSDNTSRCSLSTPRFVDFHNEYLFMVMTCAKDDTRSAFLYWSYDAGNSWRVSRLPKADGSLEFYGALNGWYSQASDAGSAFSYEILYTEDGGVSWNTISQTAWNSRLQFITGAIGWGVVDYNGQYAMVKTEDGGYTWLQVFPLVEPQ